MGESGLNALSRHIVLLATPTAQSLEIAGPIEIFATAMMKLREARLLAESDQSLEQVAERVGFGSVDTMDRAFRRQTGELPSTWRARALGEPA
jgi:hypothetical protein